MTVYTQANPFEKYGVKVWRKWRKPGVLCVRDAFEFSPTFYLESDVVNAIAALLDAESHPPTWTEQEDGTWRKGRWTGGVDTTGRVHPEYVMHDDFPGSQWRNDQTGYGTRFLRTGHKVLTDFLAHLATIKTDVLPDPEVGEHIWLERRGEGRFAKFHTGRVLEIKAVLGDRYLTLDAPGDPGHYLPSSPCDDSRAQIIAWGLIEPEFTPLPVPNVGQWGEFTLRGGSVVEGEVTESYKRDKHVWIVRLAGLTPTLYINRTARAQKDEPTSRDIIAWTPTERPQPDEPTGFGAVVNVNGWRYVRVPGVRPEDWSWIRHGESRITWDVLVKRGPVTVESAGVDK